MRSPDSMLLCKSYMYRVYLSYRLLTSVYISFPIYIHSSLHVLFRIFLQIDYPSFSSVFLLSDLPNTCHMSSHRFLLHGALFYSTTAISMLDISSLLPDVLGTIVVRISQGRTLCTICIAVMFDLVTITATYSQQSFMDKLLY